jgi:hypothetical protein
MADSPEEVAAFHAGGALFERAVAPAAHVAELIRVGADEVREAAWAIARPDRLDVVAVGLLEDGEDERLTDVVEGWKGPR